MYISALTLFLHIWIQLTLQPSFSLMMEKESPSRRFKVVLVSSNWKRDHFLENCSVKLGLNMLFSVGTILPPPSPPSHLQ